MFHQIIVRSTLALALAANVLIGVAQAEDVTTYHYDTRRTGWNPNETVLTPTTVKSGIGAQTFKMTSFTALDDQVDAQPLVVTNQPIKGKGTHDVVYIATENNTIYALDADSGAVLRQRNFGAPVPISALPGGCNNNGNNVGIGSTPVIDPAGKTMYFIAHTFNNNVQKYVLHAIDISTLGDVVNAVTIKATGTLTNGHSYNFNPVVSRQRAALLLANGNVYAAFASFCDVAADQSRGWVLGWQKDTLVPLAHNELANTRSTSTDTYFLTAIWMSGYGPAASPISGDLYFITGNSDPSGDSIDSVTNVAESAVQISSDLGTVRSVFTPDNAVSLENGDGDFGSGGLMLIPPQAGATPNMAVGAGKDGQMYLLNADDLNNHTSGDSRVLGTYGIGSCWCGPSYFTGGDGVGRVVSSGNDSIDVWKIKTGAHSKLNLSSQSAGMGGVQEPGFFTAVSSNGTTVSTAVIWAVSRPDGSDAHNVSLFAFDGGSAKTKFSGVAGTWPNTGGNANIVPVVANSHVYVASFQGLSIFGLSSSPPARVPASLSHVAAARAPLAPGMHEVFGTVRAINGYLLTVEKRDRSLLTVDVREAQRNLNYAQPTVGHGVLVRGAYSGKVLSAAFVFHAKDHASMWQSDR